jgi:3-oxoadipate CoA-transferase, alpha subunit
MKPVFDDPMEAVAEVQDGASIMIGGFAGIGVPFTLLRALAKRGVKDLTIIGNGTSTHVRDAEFPENAVHAWMVAKAIVSFPVTASPRPGNPFDEGYEKGTIKLELVPQGTLAERIRAGGAGIPAFYTPTGVGTPFAEGKEVREIDGREYVLEHGLTADFALIRAFKADRIGNLIYRNAGRNFNPIMATAGRVTVVQVEELVEVGELDPEVIVTPGIYVDRIVVVGATPGA